MAEERQSISRAELYELVWSKALVTLAPKLGLSDVGLAKACRRMEIPVPWRGYWAKKQAGHTVKRTPLPKPSRNLTTQTLQLRANESGIATDGVKTPLSGPIADQQQYEADPANAITVAEMLEKPHSLVAATIRGLRGARVGENGLIHPKVGACLDVQTSIASADRAMRIMHAVLVACERREWPVRVEKTDPRYSTDSYRAYKSSIRVDGWDIGFRLIERTMRKPRPENDKQGRYGRNRDWIIEPTGNLAIELDANWTGARAVWADGARQRLEQMLNPLMIGLVAISEKIRERDERIEEENRKWEEERRRREAEEARKRAVAERDRILDDLIARQARTARIREYVASVRALANFSELESRNPALREWINWCTARADELDPIAPHPLVPTKMISESDEDYGMED